MLMEAMEKIHAINIMTRFIRLLIFSLAFAQSTGSLYAQPQSLADKIQLHTRQYPQERLYIHFERNSYFAGETIWFKSYLREGYDGYVTSKTLYIDLLDDKGTLIRHHFFPVVNSTSFGQIDIPKTCHSPFVMIRAYTRWMLNFENDFVFEKKIPVIATTTPATTTPTASSVSLKIFPEGGNVIADVRTKFAFLASDQQGRPIEAQFKVKDENNATIATSETIHNGMGLFYLTPQLNKNYKIEWHTNDNAIRYADFPQIHEAGLSLSVQLKDNFCHYALERRDPVDKIQKRYTVVAMMYNQLLYLARTSLDPRGSANGKINTCKMPTGVLQLTILDETNLPVAERIVFIKQKDFRAEVQLDFVKLNLDNRGENEIDISMKGSSLANLSLAVSDASFQTQDDENIFSSLLLSSQIKGKVYRPDYYFSDDTEEINRHLDLVMLTQGWRRYRWKAIADGQELPTAFHKDSTYLYLKGKVQFHPGQIRKEEKIMLLFRPAKDTAMKRNFSLLLPLKKDGQFTSDELLYMDTLNVYYTFPDKRTALRNHKISLEQNNFLPALPANRADGNQFNAIVHSAPTGAQEHFALLADRHDKTLLEEVIVTARVKTAIEKLDEKYAGGLFSGMGKGVDFMNQKETRYINNLEGCIQWAFPSLKRDYQRPIYYKITNMSGGPIPVDIFLDGMKVSLNEIKGYDCSNIAYMKFFDPPFVLMGSPGGALAIFTKRGPDLLSTDSRGLEKTEIVGYSLVKEFYSPDYSAADMNTSQDIRNTLLWKHTIILDQATQKVRHRFFNNDITNSFRVVLQGVNEKGQLIYIEKLVK